MKFTPLERSINLAPDDSMVLTFKLDAHNDLENNIIVRGIRWELEIEEVKP